MRVASMAVLAVAAALAAGLQPAGAVHNDRYCMRGDCSYHTWEQCMASASGHGAHYRKNPRWHGSRRGSR
jgi:hypothetical protein